MTRSERLILEALTAARPGGLTRDRLMDLLYADNPDGGALTNTIKVFVSRLRDQISDRIELQFGSHRYFLLKGNEALPRTKAEDILSQRSLGIFQAIRRRPGINTQELADCVGVKANAVGIYISKTNRQLELLNQRLVGKCGSGYRVVELTA